MVTLQPFSSISLRRPRATEEPLFATAVWSRAFDAIGPSARSGLRSEPLYSQLMSWRRCPTPPDSCEGRVLPFHLPPEGQG